MKTTGLNGFTKTTVDIFNARFCGGNPLIADEDSAVYFKLIDRGMVTVACEDGMWLCEVTDGWETGIAQSDYHDTPWDAWADTRRQLKRMED